MVDLTIDGVEWVEVPTYSDPADNDYLVMYDGFANDLRMWKRKPTLPTEDGYYQDRDGDLWKYDALEDSWYELNALHDGAFNPLEAYHDPQDYLPLVKVA